MPKPNATTIIDEYIEISDKYHKIYGNKTVVLMEVGGFFEIYSVKNDTEDAGADIYNVCDLLNIQVSRKNKHIVEVSRTNHLLAGFPSHAMKKFLDILVSHRYTVVVVEQVTPPPGPKRAVTNIISTSTHIEQISKSNDTSGMMVFYVETVECWKTKGHNYVVGWSYLDALTGTLRCGEIKSMKDAKLLVDELHRILLLENPSEVVVASGEKGLVDANEQIWSDLRWLFTSTNTSFHDKLHNLHSVFLEKTYQTEMLRKVYPKHGLLSPIEFVDLETRPLALVSLVYLLQFAYEHNETIVLNVSKPFVVMNEWGSSQTGLTLASNCIQQLDIVQSRSNEEDGRKTQSLLSILNNCQTAIGRRYFKRRLLAPLTGQADIRKTYDRTDALIARDGWKRLETCLHGILDIERLYRRLQMRRIQPCEFVTLFQSILSVHVCVDELKDLLDTDTFNKFDVHMFNIEDDGVNNLASFRETCESTIDMDSACKQNLETLKTNIFKLGVDDTIDDICRRIGAIKCVFTSPITELSDISKGEWDGWMKLEHNDKDGYYYSLTGKRFDVLKQRIKGGGINHNMSESFRQLVVDGLDTASRNTANGVKIQTRQMRQMSTELAGLHDDLKSTTLKVFHVFTDSLQLQFEDFVRDTVTCLENIDFHTNCAKNAVKMGHVRPVIDDACEKSFVDIEDLRHPIIENIRTNLEYVPNSIKLGTQDMDQVPNGMVLYGVNAAGKSSLMKSVGIAVIMAQAGLFVSARKMVYSPYETLFTRIQSNDDIYRGMSTFSMEISELRNILKRADARSLVIGDELCSGTETVSGVSIVCAGIKTLVDKGSTFLFATHLHQLTGLKVISNLTREGRICIKHLSVTYDELGDVLIYDRKLREGPGKELYGLEVCKALDLDPKFLHLAGQVRHELLQGSHTMVANNTARYNRGVIMNDCKVCGVNHSQSTIEAHHIEFQSRADGNDLMDGRYHKNVAFNLVPLCNQCHDSVHNGDLVITGWMQTSTGVILQYEWTSEKADSDPLDIVRKHRSEVVEFRKTHTIKETIGMIKSVYAVTISDYKLNRVLKEII